MEFDELNITK